MGSVLFFEFAFKFVNFGLYLLFFLWIVLWYPNISMNE